MKLSLKETRMETLQIGIFYLLFLPVKFINVLDVSEQKTNLFRTNQQTRVLDDVGQIILRKNTHSV